MCPKCPEGQQYKSLDEFCKNRNRPDGKNAYCKECMARRCRDWRDNKRKRENTPEDDVGDEEGGEEDEDDDDESYTDLYVMQNSRIPGEVKIGKSSNPENRKKSLQASQNFRINLLAAFPDAGHIETRVHAMLAYCRVLDVPGREWFACSAQTAFAAIGNALAEQKE